MKFVSDWVTQSPYAQALGVELADLSEDCAKLNLPFKEENSNPGQALHGGIAVSLTVISSNAVTRAAMGEEAGPWHTAAFQINYLAAAIGEPVTAEARLLRKGKEICFCEVDIATPEGKSIAHATSVVHGRFGKDPVTGPKSPGDDGQSDPGPMGPGVGKLPFIGSRGIAVELMKGGRSRLVMPWKPANGDLNGGCHEGAALALLDTAGAMACWAETGPGRYRAGTPSMQCQILSPVPATDLVAYGHVYERDDELFWSDVEVASAQDATVYARGTVIYRIVT